MVQVDGIQKFTINMNNFPTFNPNEPLLNQISSNKLNLVSGGQKSNQIQSGVGYRLTQTPGGTTMNTIKRRTPVYVHPWKATANGDDTVRIAQGYAMNWGTSGDISLGFSTDWVEFTGDDVTVTEDGTIWAIVNASESVPGYFWFNANFITVGLNPTIVADEIHIPICDVTLTDGIAKVTKQYLRQDISMPM